MIGQAVYSHSGNSAGDRSLHSWQECLLHLRLHACSLRAMRIARSIGGAAVGEAVSGPERKGETANRFKGTMLNSGGVWDMPTRDLAQGPPIGLLREAAAEISNRRIRHRGHVAAIPLHTFFGQDAFGNRAGAE